MAKILVIDNDKNMLSFLQMELSHDGHKVFIANDGEEGVQSFCQFNPDLIITNIVMPYKDGVEVIMDVRLSHPKLPIIAMAEDHRAMSAGLALDIAKSLGATTTLLKPFTKQELQEVIKLVLN